jgi:hypothetical protein
MPIRPFLSHRPKLAARQDLKIKYDGQLAFASPPFPAAPRLARVPPATRPVLPVLSPSKLVIAYLHDSLGVPIMGAL